MNKFITKLLISVLGICLFFLCCNTKMVMNIEPKVTFLNYDFSGNDVLVGTKNTYLNIEQIDDYVIFEYSGDSEVTFRINFPAHMGYKIFRNDTTELLYEDKYKFVIYPQKDTLDIYWFISNPLKIDGAQDLFFSPQLGIILIKSTTWPTFSELSEHYLVPQNVKQLTSILLYKEYLSVALKIPIEEPPHNPQ